MVTLAVNFRRSAVIAGLWGPKVARPGNFVSNFCVFWITIPYGKIFKILFGQFSPRQRSTLFVLFNFHEMLPTGNRRNRALFTSPKKFGCLSNCRYCADRAQNCQGQPPTFGSHCSRFQISVNFQRSYSRTREGNSFAIFFNYIDFHDRRFEPIFLSSMLLSRISIFKDFSPICRNAHHCVSDSPWLMLLFLTL